MSRLTAAGYLENGKLNNHFSTSYKYDLMGNILTLRREGLLDSGDYGTIDDLTYSYEGNQVVKIDDAADESPSYSGAMHFRDAANEETEYTYDANGNMLTDSNKGITSIDYNVLDLPQCINVKPNVLGNSDNKVCYTYSADGTKLSSTYKNGDSQVLPYRPKPSSSIKTNGMVTPMVKSLESNYHYCSNLVYNNDRLSTILFDGGYASVDEGGGIAMHFYVKDHLGSNRLVVDGNGNIEEVNHYYPFGALMGDRCGVSRNKYKYIGKELDTMYGWNMQDHEARWYDPVLGIWHSIDMLAEKAYNISPYVSCDDNHVRYIDLDGKKKHNWIENDKNNSRYNNASYQKRFINNGIIQIWAHGLKTQNIEGPAFAIGVSVDRYTHKRFGEGYYHNLSHDKNQIKNAEQLASYLYKYDKEWRERGSSIVIILHSCATSELAKKFSESPKFRDVIFIAPNNNLETSRTGDEFVKDRRLNSKTVLQGKWCVYRNGVAVRDSNGKPVTYSNTAQPGTINFKYKFK